VRAQVVEIVFVTRISGHRKSAEATTVHVHLTGPTDVLRRSKKKTSGKHTKSYGKSPFYPLLMGKSTIHGHFQ
jgi:hypothetical protein